jgi:hypothetical protein
MPVYRGKTVLSLLRDDAAALFILAERGRCRSLRAPLIR